jgi:hypothetical protein
LGPLPPRETLKPIALSEYAFPGAGVVLLTRNATVFGVRSLSEISVLAVGAVVPMPTEPVGVIRMRSNVGPAPDVSMMNGIALMVPMWSAAPMVLPPTTQAVAFDAGMGAVARWPVGSLVTTLTVPDCELELAAEVTPGRS